MDTKPVDGEECTPKSDPVEEPNVPAPALPNIVVEKPNDLAPSVLDMETSNEAKAREEDVVSDKLDVGSLSSSHPPSASTAPTTPNFEGESLDTKDIELLQNGFIQLNTHDISLVDQHIRLEKFDRDLQDGVDALWTSRNYPRYKEVRVLLMRWEEDNLGVEEELLRLKTVFSRLYRYDVECFEIPSQSPARVTGSKVSSLIAECGVDSLIIIYYGGHAVLSQQRNCPAVWAATDRPKSVKFSSFGVQQILEEATSDVLLLYDCCYASHPAVNSAGQGVTEVIAACGFEVEAPAVGPHSFTNALIQELEESFNGAPFYAAELHSKILGSLKNWKPNLLRDSHGNVWIDENGRPKYECHKRRTPVHCLLTTERPNRTIMLAPLRSTSSPRDEIQTRDAAETFGINILGPNTYPRELQNPPQFPEVLISVRLEDDYLADDDDSENERRQQPWREVKIHGAYRSYSTLLLLSMPVALWNILPAHAAYSFIGFVNSGNLAPQSNKVPEKVTVTDSVEFSAASKQSTSEQAPPPKVVEEKRPILVTEPVDKLIKFLDPNGHKFLFPFWMCQTWEGMKTLIHEALAMDKELLPFVDEGRYRLFDINETVILPSLWVAFIRPGMNITMRIWPPVSQMPPSTFNPSYIPDPTLPCPTCSRNPYGMNTYAHHAPPSNPSAYASYWQVAPQEPPVPIQRDSMERISISRRPTDPTFGEPFNSRAGPRESIRRPTILRPRNAYVYSGSDTDDSSDPEAFKRHVEKKWKVEKGPKPPQRAKVTVERAAASRGDSTLVGSLPGSRTHNVAYM
ncbi:hypothetical protein BKA65DRAFT_470949 [Rhexocercosporidium sp. MPI-PUGE-AT-0058]|nr:hypothetical protein BKA65DRAFT_470949 [Rhexocercosporidium sp. MPI-PUGE-AT-0058]